MRQYITIGGGGTRLKNLSPIDKHLLYYKDKRIIEWILSIIPNAIVIGYEKTNNRVETLKQIKYNENILIVDCDIIPFGFNESMIDENTDTVYVFESKKNKWGSVLIDDNKKIIDSSESLNLSDIKCSGIYYIKNLQYTLNKMTNPNSIISGMIGANIIYENTFMRLGDVEDYTSAIKL